MLIGPVALYYAKGDPMYPQKTLSLLALGAVCLCAVPATACA